jgi:release factor glutamine methyltransferase
MTSIAEILKKNHSGERFLDSEILLAHVLNTSRSYLHAFSEREMNPKEEQHFDTLIQKRLQGMPIAYLTGHREFWSLDLQVTQDTLIPRPETELLVELVLTQTSTQTARVADLGTGTGAIALALAHEYPHWQIIATDNSQAALNVAKNNASRLKMTNIAFYKGFWCDALPVKEFDRIVSNPPYIAIGDRDVQKDVLQYEPRLALISEKDGLSDIQHIIHSARSYLKQAGLLFLEHGYKQGEKVRNIFLNAGYNNVITHCDLAGLERVTQGTCTE